MRELSEKNVMQFFENTPHHHWLWMRMYRKGTTFFYGDLSPLQVHHGIALDVYPLIGVADSAFGFRLQRDALNLARALRLVEFWWGRRLSEKPI